MQATELVAQQLTESDAEMTRLPAGPRQVPDGRAIETPQKGQGQWRNRQARGQGARQSRQPLRRRPAIGAENPAHGAPEGVMVWAGARQLDEAGRAATLAP